MENQHKKITGYRELTQEEIDLMNEIKLVGSQLELLCKAIEKSSVGIDERWLSIGQTSLQQGMMALTRAVAKPTHF
jgi:hypothetical protein